MYCPNCGKKVKDGAKFCSYCGEPLENPEEYSDIGGEEAPAGTRSGARNGFLSTTAGKVALIVVIAAAVVVAAVGGMAAYRHSQTKNEMEQVEDNVRGEDSAESEAEAAEEPSAEETAEEPEVTEITDEMYPELLEGGLTKEQLEIALAYAPEEMENGDVSTEDLMIMVDEITYDFPEECFGGTYTEEWTDFGSGYYTYSLSEVNNFLSVLTDKQLSESDMRQWNYPDELSISGDTVTVMLYDGEWMTPLADITDAVLGDGEITVTYNVRARGNGDYYPESTGTRTAALKPAADGGYRVDRIFMGTMEEPYRIDRQVLQIMDEYGYEEEWAYYDIISLEDKDEAHSAINASLVEDYQAYLDYSVRVTGKSVDEIKASTNAGDYNADAAGVTNIKNGVLSIKYRDMIMEGDVMGTWYYGLTFSLETGQRLNITDLTDLGDDELLSGIKSAITDYINRYDFTNKNEMLNKVNTYTLGDIGSGYNFWDTYRLSFCVDDDEIVILIPPGELFDSIWSNQTISTGIYIRGAEWKADGNPYMALGDDYILPYSSSEYISEYDLLGLSSDELRLARNEIYARHGRKFDDPELREYFNSKSWYNGTIEPGDFDDDSILNEYEKENVKLIQSREEELNGTGTGIGSFGA